MYDELRWLLLIAEHGTFTDAARRAHISQPALTAAMQRLEASFGAQLLHRGRQGAELTAAGRALVPRARASLAAIEDGRRAVAEVAGLHAGEVHLGAGATACTYLLPPVVAKFRAGYPGIRFRLREQTADESIESLHAGEIDLAVVSRPEGEPWIVDELIVVAAPQMSHHGAPFVTFRVGTTTRELFERNFPEADVVMELGSIAAVKGSVRAGIGKALVSRWAVVDDLAQRRLVRVRDPRTPIKRELNLLHRGLDRLPPAAATLRELLLSREGKAHLRRGARA
jgi:DNA-binding transcriptional LysR family regulator